MVVARYVVADELGGGTAFAIAPHVASLADLLRSGDHI